MRAGNVVFAVFSSVFKVVVTVVIVLLIYKGAMYGYEFGYNVFQQEAMSVGEGRTVMVEITEDMSVKDIGDQFLAKGLIDDTLLFTAQYYLSEFQKDVQPGTYELSTAMAVEKMMEIMATPPEDEEEDANDN